MSELEATHDKNQDERTDRRKKIAQSIEKIFTNKV